MTSPRQDAPRPARAALWRTALLAAGVILISGALLKAAAAAFFPSGKPPPQAPAVDARAHADGHERDVKQLFQSSTAALAGRRYQDAARGLTSLLAIAPNLPEAHVNMGFALLGLGKHGEARDHFLTATELRRMQINAYYGLALAYEGLDDLVLARGAMRSYIHLAGEKNPYREKAAAYLDKWDMALEPRSAGAGGGDSLDKASPDSLVPKSGK